MKRLKPTTSGSRKMSFESRENVTAKKPYKKLTVKLTRHSGRDSFGRISIRHRGGGSKRLYRLIDFSPERVEGEAVVKTVEYDPNRNTRIALVERQDGSKNYILAVEGVKVGSTVSFGSSVEVKLGSRLPLKKIPTGTAINSIELTPNSKAKAVRSAGTAAVILSKDSDWIHIKLPSGEVRKFNPNCFASIGQLSNAEHKMITIGKAGRTRHMGRKPVVRGKAMNPVSHPHGGGEGVNPIGLKYPKTPWGKIAIGGKTRKVKNPTDVFRVRRRK